MEIYNIEYFKDYLEKLFKTLGIKITMQLVDRGEYNTDILLTYNDKVYRLNEYNDIQEEKQLVKDIKFYTTRDNEIILLDFNKIIKDNELTKDCDLQDCTEIASDILMEHFDGYFSKDCDNIAIEIYQYLKNREE